MTDAILTFVARFIIGLALGCVLFLMTGCEDRYRYACQNPDNFYKAECQKPKCLFTQQCPEYLVAPILEKQVAPQNATPEPTTPNR
mgnify:FL=1|jgi:hypothetical protein